jgi:hypothetical protein
MLFKKIALLYGASLHGKVAPRDDVVAAVVMGEDLRAFRRRALEDIAGARILLLDGPAAAYADRFRDDVQDFEFSPEGNGKLEVLMREIVPPHGLTWIEHDHRALFSDRISRGQVGDPDQDPMEFGLRGFLIDDRAPDALRVTMHRSDARLTPIDPTLSLHFGKGPDGVVDFSKFRIDMHPHMVRFYRCTGLSEEGLQAIVDCDWTDATYDLGMAYMVFALLGSDEVRLLSQSRPSLSSGEIRTARKFGRTWAMEALRSHDRLGVGPDGEAHLQRMAARRARERAAIRRSGT